MFITIGTTVNSIFIKIMTVVYMLSVNISYIINYYYNNYIYNIYIYIYYIKLYNLYIVYIYIYIYIHTHIYIYNIYRLCALAAASIDDNILKTVPNSCIPL